MLLFSLPDFVGHFHPVLVHLPIGILLLAVIFQWMSEKQRYANLMPALQPMWMLGTAGALASCITGYALAQSGDYEEGLTQQHQWLGIATMLAGGIMSYLQWKSAPRRVLKSVSLIILVMLTITGHWGGTITHGSGYLLQGLEDSDNKGPAIKPVANIPQAQVYADAVAPLLEARCYSCHGPSKMKGKLRLDSKEFIFKGGENGKAITPGQPGNSQLIEKLLLPLHNEEHMPPKEKPQLTKEEVALLHWWISVGAPFDKKFGELPQDNNVKPILTALLSGNAGGADGEDPGDIPDADVPAASAEALHALTTTGAMVVPVASNSPFLAVSFASVQGDPGKAVQLLEPIRRQVAWLNAAHSGLTDKQADGLGRLENLTRLNLRGTKITDAALTQINSLKALRYLNLSGTLVTARGLANLSGPKELRKVYLWQTRPDASVMATLKKNWPKATIDTGGYHVPTLPQDTTLVTWAP